LSVGGIKFDKDAMVFIKETPPTPLDVSCEDTSLMYWYGGHPMQINSALIPKEHLSGTKNSGTEEYGLLG
jgi:hypothetical protein